MDVSEIGIETLSYRPLAVLAVTMTFVIVGIAVARIHPFLVLTFAAMLVGLLSDRVVSVSAANDWAYAVELAMSELGIAAGNLAFVIMLAAIIGTCMRDSGAADRIVQGMVVLFGEKGGAFTLLAAGFLLSMPVFFDTVFFLLLPLARALALRTGGSFLLYVLAICTGGVITHTLVAPTPGPLMVAETLLPAGVELGTSIMAGMLAGLIPATGMYYLARWLDLRLKIPVRALADSDIQVPVAEGARKLPPLSLSLLPVAVPVILIAGVSILDPSLESGTDMQASPFLDAQAYLLFFGNKNIAMLVGALIALWLMMRQTGLSVPQCSARLTSAVSVAAVIILITAAGGAFGAMIRHSGVGEVIRDLAENYSINYVLLAWLVTAVVRVAQGSATVAMITAAGLMAAILGDGTTLAVHPVYIFLAIGFGALFCSWMNDSGFWVVGKLSGFTEHETLKTWTVLTTFISVVGLVQILIASALVPLR